MARTIQPFTYQFERKVKTSTDQIKKHCSQMNTTEVAILTALVNSLDVNHLRITNHAREHIPFLNKSIVSQTLKSFDVIEFNLTNGNPRVLIRSKKQLNIIVDDNMDVANVCIVIGVKEMIIITAYLNCTDDVHSTLHMDRYDSTINIVEIAMGLN